jgi:4-amino-4-deoxy-L-arabinose transferase-like glycosyltransferase
LVFAFIVRVYRINDLLGFYFDQGRDALVIWKFWHEGKLFLIGPVTGLAGIFLGPLYYYLIAPLYLIGNGNPVYPIVFLAFLSTLSLAVLYQLGREIYGRKAGIIAAIIGAFSYNLVGDSRWLSNPNPIFLSSTILFYSMWKVISGGNRSWLIVTFLMAGLSLQFEAASGVFYIPVLLIFILWQRAKLKTDIKVVLLSFLVFSLTLSFQILFNFRHENIILNNFLNLFVGEKSFRLLSFYLLEKKISFFWYAFVGRVSPNWGIYALIFTSLSFAAIYVKRSLLKPGVIKLFLIFLLTPLIGYTFFQGNFGILYDYYLSGYYLPFILLFSIGLSIFSEYFLGKIALLWFLIILLPVDGKLLINMMKNPMDGPTDIKFGSQLKAVDFVLMDGNKEGEFNLDVYVPPVIPYAYEYLVLWRGNILCADSSCGLTKTKDAKIIYYLYEQDPPHPERLEVWLTARKNDGTLVGLEKFGGITVEKRQRN